MYRGDDATFAFTLTQGGVAVDLTGAAIVFSARAELTDVAPLVTLTEADGDITILPDQTTTGKGKITLKVPHAVSVDLDVGTYFADFEVTETDGDVWTWPEPTFDDSTLIRFRVKADVTQP